MSKSFIGYAPGNTLVHRVRGYAFLIIKFLLHFPKAWNPKLIIVGHISTFLYLPFTLQFTHGNAKVNWFYLLAVANIGTKVFSSSTGTVIISNGLEGDPRLCIAGT